MYELIEHIGVIKEPSSEIKIDISVKRLNGKREFLSYTSFSFHGWKEEKTCSCIQGRRHRGEARGPPRPPLLGRPFPDLSQNGRKLDILITSRCWRQRGAQIRRLFGPSVDSFFVSIRLKFLAGRWPPLFWRRRRSCMYSISMPTVFLSSATRRTSALRDN